MMFRTPTPAALRQKIQALPANEQGAAIAALPLNDSMAVVISLYAEAMSAWQKKLTQLYFISDTPLAFDALNKLISSQAISFQTQLGAVNEANVQRLLDRVVNTIHSKWLQVVSMPALQSPHALADYQQKIKALSYFTCAHEFFSRLNALLKRERFGDATTAPTSRYYFTTLPCLLNQLAIETLAITAEEPLHPEMALWLRGLHQHQLNQLAPECKTAEQIKPAALDKRHGTDDELLANRFGVTKSMLANSMREHADKLQPRVAATIAFQRIM